MEAGASVSHFTNDHPYKTAQMKQKKKGKNPKGKQYLQQAADIVYAKGSSFQTVPSLGKVLNRIIEPMLGLQYVWEYRSPSKTVPPHYLCKICSVTRLLQDMVAHVKSWKHNLRYLVAIKEPCTIPAFKGLPTAVPKALPPPGPGMGPNGPPFSPMFNEQSFHDDFPPNEGPYEEYPGEFEPSDYEGFPSDHGFPDSGMGPGSYPDGPGDNFRANREQGRFNPDEMFDEYQSPTMGGRLMDIDVKKPFGRQSPMQPTPDSGFDSNVLLDYLDTFRIENEKDAQLVLKVTQKLTDLLMEFRLRSISSAGPSMSSLSMNSSFSSMSSSLPRSSDRYSRPLPKGPSCYSDGPLRF
ncbi:uncharacterized protein si:ch211-197h24.6 isoform X2 [Dunckerocampus dactyliophorus]|uniref:uncharacterized protein si:ch211-197h24.6 isoform X2 n=1 Tax=Dunckerocampus dactyliophorus TaxID=161453 RepID=UPI002405D131|nr:uncharacterized protein si:ch211-197h24.6 isoform X2 [Dunckerocampus dactyliophorus]